MTVRVYPSNIHGRVYAPTSKSHAIRLIICAFLSGGETFIAIRDFCRDIDIAINAIVTLGAKVARCEGGISVSRYEYVSKAVVNCEDCGAVFRFLVPVVCALGIATEFRLSGRLPDRPMADMYSSLEKHGARVSGAGESAVQVSGKLTSGEYGISGNVSSQFISGLSLALPLVGGASRVNITTPEQSSSYVDITLSVMRLFGVNISRDDKGISVLGGGYSPVDCVEAEGDWTNAAVLMCMASVCGGDVQMLGLNYQSVQPDRAILGIMGNIDCVDIGENPDIAAAVALLMVKQKGVSRIINVSRLSLKESDRVSGIADTINALGGKAEYVNDAISIIGGEPLNGGYVDSRNDHRIVMLAACLSAYSAKPITITRAEAVNKSYPKFFDDLRALGARVERLED